MENNQVLQQGILKSKGRFARAKQFFVASILSAIVAIASLGVSATMVGLMKNSEKQMDYAVAEFVKTEDYSDPYSKAYIEIRDDGDFEIKVSELRSYDHAVELLKNSNQEELKTRYERNEERNNKCSKVGVATAGVAVASAGLATVLYVMSENEKTKRKKEEYEEMERNQ